MNEALQELVNKIHESDTKAYIVCSGGGSEIFPLLLTGGNGSKTLLAGHIPYSQEQLLEFVVGQGHIEKVVSEDTAKKMARQAYEKAISISEDSLAVGIGLTAALQRVPEEREGRVHEVFAVLDSAFQRITAHFVFSNHWHGWRDAMAIRRVEETACSVIILRLLADYSGIKFEDSESTIGVKVKYEIEDLPVNIDIYDKYFKKTPGMGACQLIFPGSFNPPHEGHQEMVKMASDIIQWPCSLEISIQNVDKGELSKKQVAERLMAISKSGLFVHKSIYPNYSGVILTKAPTFVEKAKLFPEATFVIGFDTALRIVDPKYGMSVEDTLTFFEGHNTKFILFPRITDGVLKDDLSVLPERFRNLCTFVRKPRQYAHLSSREIRNEKA
jgi:hypothetical protein